MDFMDLEWQRGITIHHTGTGSDHHRMHLRIACLPSSYPTPLSTVARSTIDLSRFGTRSSPLYLHDLRPEYVWISGLHWLPQVGNQT